MLEHTDTSITLTWSPVAGATQYRLEWRVNGGTWLTDNCNTIDNCEISSSSTKKIQTIQIGDTPQFLTPDTSYDFRVSARRSSTDNWGDGKLATFKTDKEFVITALAKGLPELRPGQEYDFNASSPRWGVLDPYNVDIVITKKYGNDPIPAGWKFRLALDRDNTGLQFSDNHACNWTSPKSETGWTDPLSSPTVEFTITDAKIVRCGKGNEKNSGLTVKASNGTRVSSYGIADDMKEAWHRDGTSVTYYIDSTAVHGGQGGTPPPMLVDSVLIKEAADVWNAVIRGFDITPATDMNSAGIVIRIFDGNHGCSDAVACTKKADGSVYPDMAAGQPFWVEKEPQVGTDPVKPWLVDYIRFERAKYDSYYLPTILVHEFGHTIGLQHSNVMDTVMSGHGNHRDARAVCRATDRTQCGLTNDDKQGAKSIYEWR